MTRSPAGRRAICTLAIGRHAELWDLAEPAVHRYAVRHGYHVVRRDALPDLSGRPPAWAKLPLVLELLDEHDVVVWLDADTFVVDPTHDIADDARGRQAIHLVTHRIDGVHVPNSGVMVVRRAPGLHRLLERVWQRTEHVHHPWWENAALIDALGGDADRGLVDAVQQRRARRVLGSLPHRWNSVEPDPHPHPAIVHFAGLPFERRLAGMRALAAGQERVSTSRSGVRPRNGAPNAPSTSTTTCVATLT